MDFISIVFNGSLYSPSRGSSQDEKHKRMMFSDLVGLSCIPQTKQANLEKRCWCLIKQGKMDKALHISSRMRNRSSRSRLQAAICFRMGERGYINQEFSIAKQITDKKCKANALEEAFFHSVKKENWELAERVAKIFPNQRDKIEAFSMLAKVYVYLGEAEKVRRTSEHIFHHLKSPPAIWEIAGHFFDQNELKEAFLFVQALPDECPKTLFLIRIMRAFSKKGEADLVDRVSKFIF